MQHKSKLYIVIITSFAMLSLTMIPFAAAAGAITLDPTAQSPGATVTVSGTTFGATKAVASGSE